VEKDVCGLEETVGGKNTEQPIDKFNVEV